MGIADRPDACASCGKRLSRKQWYYRNGKYFCKRRCWETEQAKLQQERAEAAAKAQEAKPAPEGAAPQDAKTTAQEAPKPQEAAGTDAGSATGQTAEAKPAEFTPSKDPEQPLRA